MNEFDIAAFVWPSYTGDEKRSRIFWPDGEGEWQSVRGMTNKGYKGCSWPRKPLWGYLNEADSSVMERQIDCALQHSVNTFIYDWYWYDNRPFLENCLNDGFLKAKNNKKMKFYLMWANHNATYLWDKRNSSDTETVVWSGVVSEQIFSEICDRTIEKYFTCENYYKIDNCPVWMVFDIDNFIRNFGTSTKCRKAVEEFRSKCVKAGFVGLHLQFVHWKNRGFDWLSDNDENKGMTMQEMYAFLGADSVTNYNWGGSLNLDGDYSALTDEYMEKLNAYTSEMNIPFYPNITIGWDNNVRFNDYIPGVVEGNTPEAFEKACSGIKDFALRSISDGRMTVPLITVNSWNEWTETSYLEPDDLYGYGYLEAIKKVFG